MGSSALIMFFTAVLSAFSACAPRTTNRNDWGTIHVKRTVTPQRWNARIVKTDDVVRRDMVSVAPQKSASAKSLIEFGRYDTCRSLKVFNERNVTRYDRTVHWHRSIGVFILLGFFRLIDWPIIIIRAIRARDTVDLGKVREGREPHGAFACHHRSIPSGTRFSFTVGDAGPIWATVGDGAKQVKAFFAVADAYEMLRTTRPLSVKVEIPVLRSSAAVDVPSNILNRAAAKFLARGKARSSYDGDPDSLVFERPRIKIDSSRSHISAKFQLRNVGNGFVAPIYLKLDSTTWRGSRYLYLGDISPGATRETSFLSPLGNVRNGREKIDVSLMSSIATNRLIRTEHIAIDSAGHVYGDWRSEGDDSRSAARVLAEGQMLEGTVNGEGGDLTDWVVVSAPRKGRVEIRVQGQGIAVGELAGDHRALDPSGLSNEVFYAGSDLQSAVRSARLDGGAPRGRSVEFMGGGGRYYIQLMSAGPGISSYRVEARVTPVEVRAGVIDRVGADVRINKGAIDGVYVGRQGRFYFRRRYKAGAFRVLSVTDHQSVVEVTQGAGEVHRRLNRLDAHMPISRDD